MRTLIVTAAEKPHFLHMVPLAWALRGAGHEVLVASQPELGRTVAGAGLPFFPVGRDHDYWRVVRAFSLQGDLRSSIPPFGHADRPAEDVSWEYLREGYRRVVPWWWRMVNDPMAADLVDLCRSWRPDLVVWTPVTYSAAVAAEAVGAAHVRFPWGSDIYSRMRGIFRERYAETAEEEREDLLADWLRGLARRHGVEFSESLVNGHATLVHVPDSVRSETPDDVRRVPVRFVPYNGSALVPAWLRERPDRPRVCLTLGVSATERQEGYRLSLADAVEGLAETDAEIVVTLPGEQLGKLGPLPGNVRPVEHVPLHVLAPTCDLVVSHGGWGTVLTCLYAGVPQLVSPHWFDNAQVGRRLADLGSALSPAPEETGAGELRDAAARLLGEPSFTREAERLRAEVEAMPSPRETVRVLESLAKTADPHLGGSNGFGDR